MPVPASPLPRHPPCSSLWTWAVVGTVLAACLPAAGGLIFDLLPPTVTDEHGNTADQDARVSWAQLPVWGNSSTYAGRSHNPYLAPYHSMVNLFTFVVQPLAPPAELLASFLKGTADIMKSILQLVQVAGGFAVCVALGVLFMLVTPVVGCCVCGCRTCCGRCGGRPSQAPHPRAECRRRCYSVGLILTSALMLGGVVMVLVTNDELKTEIDHLKEDVNQQLDGLSAYTVDTANEMDYIGLASYDFVLSVVNRDLDNVAALVGVPVRNTLDAKGNVAKTLEEVVAYQATIAATLVAFEKLNDSMVFHQTKMSSLQFQLDSVGALMAGTRSQTGCAGSCINALNSYMSTLQTDTGHASFPPIDSQITELRNITGVDIRRSVNEGRQMFDDIPLRVANDTQTATADTKATMYSFRDTIRKEVSGVQAVTAQMDAPLSGLKSTLGNTMTVIDTANFYRWVGGLVLGALLAVVAGLQLVGGAGSLVVYDPTIPPTQRGAASDALGRTLLATAGISFVLSWLVMLLVTVPFALGHVLDRDMCDPLSSPNSSIINVLFDGPNGILGDGYLLSGLFLGDNTVPLTITDALNGCKANKGAFEVLLLGRIFNTNNIVNFDGVIDIGGNVAKMTSDMSQITFFSSDTEAILRRFARNADIHYSLMTSTLAGAALPVSLTDMAAAMRVAANDGTNTDPAKSEMLAEADQLDTINAVFLAPADQSRSTFLANVAAADTIGGNMWNRIYTTIANVRAAESYVQLHGAAILAQQTKNFTSRILAVMTQYTDHLQHVVEHEVGRCRPVYDVWNNLLFNVLCDGLVVSWNGFWFALGWCVALFVPNIVLAIRLAKFLRRMQFLEDPPARPAPQVAPAPAKTTPRDGPQPPGSYADRPPPAIGRNNKVSPSGVSPPPSYHREAPVGHGIQAGNNFADHWDGF